MKYSALIVAAGSGTRMKLGYNKVYAQLQDGRSILQTTLSAFMNDSDCTQIIVVTDPQEFGKQMKKEIQDQAEVCAGGSTRQESVSKGLSRVTNAYVMIHDGARPFINKELLDRLKESMKDERAALLMVPVKDTIKKVRDGYVEETLVRSELMAAQTPQMFETELIRNCMNQAITDGYTGTDDASLVEKYADVKVKAVEGAYANRKITTPEDLQ